MSEVSGVYVTGNMIKPGLHTNSPVIMYNYSPMLLAIMHNCRGVTYNSRINRIYRIEYIHTNQQGQSRREKRLLGLVPSLGGV